MARDRPMRFLMRRLEARNRHPGATDEPIAPAQHLPRFERPDDDELRVRHEAAA